MNSYFKQQAYSGTDYQNILLCAISELLNAVPQWIELSNNLREAYLLGFEKEQENIDKLRDLYKTYEENIETIEKLIKSKSFVSTKLLRENLKNIEIRQPMYNQLIKSHSELLNNNEGVWAEYKAGYDNFQSILGVIEFIQGTSTPDEKVLEGLQKLLQIRNIINRNWHKINNHRDTLLKGLEKWEEKKDSIKAHIEEMRNSNKEMVKFRRATFLNQLGWVVFLLFVPIFKLLTVNNHLGESFIYINSSTIFFSFLYLLIFSRAMIKSYRKETFRIIIIIEYIIAVVLQYAESYYIASNSVPGSFNEKLPLIDSIYYSITTFTTTGYGDILPTSSFSKMIASSEMIMGFIVSTFVMAMLVSKLLSVLEIRMDKGKKSEEECSD